MLPWPTHSLMEQYVSSSRCSGVRSCSISIPLAAKASMVSAMSSTGMLRLASTPASTMASTSGRLISPSSLARSRTLLTKSSVDCSIGKSAGLASLKILSTKAAVRPTRAIAARKLSSIATFEELSGFESTAMRKAPGTIK